MYERPHKTTLRGKPKHILLHVGANDLVSDRPPDLIAKSMVDVASSMKNENHDVNVSNIITWADHSKEKANEVNDYLSNICMERNLFNWSLENFENSISEWK